MSLYSYSPKNLIKSVFPSLFLSNGSVILPDIEWKAEWFPRTHKYTSLFWQSEENCRFFLSKLRQEVLSDQSDWRQVSLTLIKQRGGMVRIAVLIIWKGLLRKYGESLLGVLKALYPIDVWSSVQKPLHYSSPQKVKVSHL